jgi:hypothetical protein
LPNEPPACELDTFGAPIGSFRPGSDDEHGASLSGRRLSAGVALLRNVHGGS